MAALAGGGGLSPWFGIVGLALFLGALIAIALNFPVDYAVLAILTVALFFVGIVVTLLNPMVRALFFFAGLVALGALAATVVRTVL